MIFSYLKVGFIGFGGGSALIPVIEKEVVEKNSFISEEDYLKQTIISNITPGALPVKLGALSSSKTSIPAAYLVAIPGVVITVLFLTLFAIIGEQAVDYIKFASVGISIFIIMLLIFYIQKVQQTGIREGQTTAYIAIMIISFLLTCGKEIRVFLGLLINTKIEGTPIFDISTINLMIIAFFIIFFIGATPSNFRITVASVISVLYALESGKQNYLPEFLYPSIVLPILMIILVACSVVSEAKAKKSSLPSKPSKKEDVKDNNFKKFSLNKPFIKNIVMFLMIPIILFVILIIVSGKIIESDVFGFLTSTAISTIASFGGGEAFISVAEGFFVETNYIGADTYYSQVVTIANALPGPILIKVQSAIAFVYGQAKFASIPIGWLLAALAMSIGIGASSIVALIVQAGFDKMKNSLRLKMIKQYILPVVCGMLVTTSLSMLNEVLFILQENIGAGIGYMLLNISFVIMLFCGMLFMHKKLHLGDLTILLSSGAFAIIVLSIIK